MTSRNIAYIYALIASVLKTHGMPLTRCSDINKHCLFSQEAPPVTEEDKAQGDALRESFKRTAGEDLEVDAYELREILNAVFTRGGCFGVNLLALDDAFIPNHMCDVMFPEFEQLTLYL